FVSPASHLLVGHSFPTRRSSDLGELASGLSIDCPAACGSLLHPDSSVRVNRQNSRKKIGVLYSFISASHSRANCPVSGPHDDRETEEHTSELQSRFDLVCRLLLE